LDGHRGSFPGIKQPGSELDHSPAVSTDCSVLDLAPFTSLYRGLEFQTCVSSKLGIAICALVESLVCRLYHSAKLDVGVTLAHPELGMEAVGAAAPPQSKIKKQHIL